eukprot:146388-Chlamydomonas_euryale.AAC.1
MLFPGCGALRLHAGVELKRSFLPAKGDLIRAFESAFSLPSPEELQAIARWADADTTAVAEREGAGCDVAPEVAGPAECGQPQDKMPPGTKILHVRAWQGGTAGRKGGRGEREGGKGGE